MLIRMPRSSSAPVKAALVSTEQLLPAYGAPPCKTREEMRRIVANIFAYQPELVRDPILLDALATGLAAYCRILLHVEGRTEATDRGKEAA